MNLVYFFFNLIYKPAISKATNYINMFVSLGLIAYEISLFVYGLSGKTSDIQETWSLALLSVAGVMLVIIVAWILYRGFLFIKKDLLGIGVAKS